MCAMKYEMVKKLETKTLTAAEACACTHPGDVNMEEFHLVASIDLLINSIKLK